MYSWLSALMGLTAFALSVLAVIVTSHNEHLILLSACLAVCACKSGFTFGVLAISINLLNLLFLSPLCAMAVTPCVDQAGIVFNQQSKIAIYSQLIAFVLLFFASKGINR